MGHLDQLLRSCAYELPLSPSPPALPLTAVWMAMASQNATGKFLGIWIPVSLFVTLGFEHSVANMFLIPQGMLNAAPVTVEQFLLGNLLPVTLGNIVGGAVLVRRPDTGRNTGLGCCPVSKEAAPSWCCDMGLPCVDSFSGSQFI